jgi:hypothetical protein
MIVYIADTVNDLRIHPSIKPFALHFSAIVMLVPE